jgi:hypothetical protein
MKNLIAIGIALALAVVLILTKPTPQEIASAAAGQMNYVVLNRDEMPRDFVAAVAAAAVVQSFTDLLSGGKNRDVPAAWQTRDWIVFTYSELSLSNFGALKCVWLLKTGFCRYRPE